MVELLTAATVLLAWFVFRYERDGRAREAVESAYATLRAVQHAMVEGRASGQDGWGQVYFQTDYPDDVAMTNAENTSKAVLDGTYAQIFVAPTEPLAKLATAAPHAGLIEYETVASASFALWHVHVFNQHAQQLTDFNTQHVDEITSETTTAERRAELAEAARSVSFMLHRWGIGWAWSVYPNGKGRGWYGELVETLAKNMRLLDDKRSRGLVRRLWGLYTVVDAAVLVVFAVVVVHVAR